MQKNSQDNEQQEFIRLYDLNFTADQIAEAMDISRSKVFRLRRQTGKPRWATWVVKSIVEIPPEELRELFDTDMTQREIADHFGVSESVIWRRARKYGIKRPAKRRKTFTETWDVEEVRAMIETEQLRTVEIQERMGGCSREAVLGFVKRHNLPYPRSNRAMGRPTRIDRELVRMLTEEGKSIAYIAEVVDCAPQSVSRIRSSLGIQRGVSGTPYPAEDRARALELLEGGASYTDVSETLTIPRETITRWYPGMGWTSEQITEYRSMLKKFEHVGVDTGRTDW